MDLRRLAWRRGGSRPRIFLHIGAMKTGTTYLQDVMHTNRAELAAAGVLYPGVGSFDQGSAARDVLGMNLIERPGDPEDEGPWTTMAADMLAHRGRASVFSMEFLSFAAPEKAAKVVESLAGADVHVILTVRDTKGTIPAQWQTSCASGGVVPLPRLVNAVARHLDADPSAPPKGPAPALFQRTQGVPRMLDVWTPLVGPKNMHVVTVPPSSSEPGLLWKRFASVVGVRPSVVTLPETKKNPSMGHPSTELLRLLNVELGSLAPRDQAYVVKNPLGRKILGSLADVEPKIRLNRRGATLASRWNGRVRETVAAHGLKVVGDLDDLPVVPPPDLPVELYEPSPDELLAAAAAGRDGLADYQDYLEASLAEPFPEDRLTHPPVPPWAHFRFEPTALRTSPSRWSSVEDAVEELAGQVRVCVGLTQQFREKQLRETDTAEPGSGPVSDVSAGRPT